ncbi:MAG: hypothetical protein HQK65_16135, partial [Desulfamplus sp.]|nr:hypothetical protein [Desulfamplus sp.]
MTTIIKELIDQLKPLPPWKNNKILSAEDLIKRDSFQNALSMVSSIAGWKPSCYGIHPLVRDEFEIYLEQINSSSEIKIKVCIKNLIAFSPDGRLMVVDKYDETLAIPINDDINSFFLLAIPVTDSKTDAKLNSLEYDYSPPVPSVIGTQFVILTQKMTIQNQENQVGIPLAHFSLENNKVKNEFFIPPAMTVAANKDILELARLSNNFLSMIKKKDVLLNQFYLTNQTAEKIWYTMSLHHFFNQHIKIIDLLIALEITKPLLFELTCKNDLLTEEVRKLLEYWKSNHSAFQPTSGYDTFTHQITFGDDTFTYCRLAKGISLYPEFECFEIVFDDSKTKFNEYIIVWDSNLSFSDSKFSVCYHLNHMSASTYNPITINLNHNYCWVRFDSTDNVSRLCFKVQPIKLLEEDT